MATVIDALIVELGLDPGNFNKGQKDAAQSIVNLDKQTEKSGKNIQQSISGVRNQILAMMAAFMAGRGLKEFIHDMVAAEAETARFSKQLDTVPEELSAIRGAATLAGGSASGALSQVQSLVDEFQRYSLTGQSSIIPYLYALNVGITDVDTGKMKTITQFYLDLSTAVQGMDPARAAALLKGAGVTDQGTLNMLLQGPKAVQAMIAEQKRLGVVTQEDAEAGLRLQHSLLALQQSSTSLGRTLLTAVAPVLVKILDAFTNLAVWMRAHKPFVEAFFATLAAVVVGLTVAFSPLTGTIALITAAIVALSGGIALLYDDWKVWTEGGQSSLSALWSFCDHVFKAIKSLFVGSADDIRNSWGALWGDLKNIINVGGGGFLSIIGKVFVGVGNAIMGAIGHALNWSQERLNVFWQLAFGHKLINKPVDFTPKESGSAFVDAGIKPAPKQAKAAAKASGKKGGAMTDEEAHAAAKASEAKYGVPAEVSYAQYVLESGRGQHMPAGSNNPFGIKAKAGQPYVESETREFLHGQMVVMKQRFAKFNSLGDAFDAHAKILATAPAYKAARAAGKDPNAYVDAMAPVYATDPNYAAHLKKIMAGERPDGTKVAGGPPSGGAAPAGAPAAAMAGAPAIAMAAGAKEGNRNVTTNTSTTKIDKVIVNSRATDAEGIAQDIKPAIERDTFASQANSGAG